MNLSTEKKNSWTWRTDLWLLSERGKEWDGLGVCGWQMQTITFAVNKQ